MAKATYSIVAILPGKSQDYFAFNRGVAINAKGEDLDSNKLSVSVTVEASSKANAEAKVQAQYPNYSIDPAATVRHA
jgi:hypothetical protein